MGKVGLVLFPGFVSNNFHFWPVRLSLMTTGVGVGPKQFVRHSGMLSKVAMSDPAKQTQLLSPITTAELMGMQLARVDRFQLLDHVFEQLRLGEGGWIVTANLDFLRRYVLEKKYEELYSAADLRVADGMPLVWASKIQGTPVPERVPGSSLVWLILERCLRENRSVYLLGGANDANPRALKVIQEKYPSLVCAGSSPMVASPPSDKDVASIRTILSSQNPDVLLVGLGSPKQEQLIQLLRPYFPKTWMIGIGITFSFISGDLARAPRWVRRIGAEWIYRMFQDPKRLVKRYLVEDLPFAMRLFFKVILARLVRKTPGPR